MSGLTTNADPARELGSSTTLDPIAATPFDRLPAERVIQAFGVDYARVHVPPGGDLFVTREGWPFLRQLLPENWYADQWYSRAGEKLAGSTGNVYRVRTKPDAPPSIEVVVKFSRVAQNVPLVVATSFPEKISPVDLANARFNSPMEEFGLVMEMRRGLYGPKDVHVLAQRPLAIYAPPEKFEVWQLGRCPTAFDMHQRLLYENQENTESAIELDIRRDYVLLYSWIKGINAEEASAAGQIGASELHTLTSRVIADLRSKGFRVLDNKPKHFIVRQQRGNGGLMRRTGRSATDEIRHGELVYGLVDFELLQRTVEYQHQFRYVRRARYWQLQSHRSEESSTPLPPHLKRMKILGVNYIYGTAPNGGKLWVVGNDSELFDFFLPDRWRRTPRLKLALTNEVYRTLTRDNIHVVYRRSRVGERPYVDPFYEQGKSIREQGYNSPFEDVAIAESLRQAGISTVYPRAIYRTGHQSTKAGYLHDERRYLTHADLLTPEPECEPILSPQHDYYTIWGYYRGMDPHTSYRPQGHWGFIDLEKALDDRLLSNEEYRHVTQCIRRRLQAIGLADPIIDDYQLVLPFNDRGVLSRDGSGELEVIWCIDALTAYEFKLVGELFYRETVEREKARLDAVGCDAPNLGGNHLLLTMTPDGELKTDEKGEIQVSLCNFELLRLRYCALPSI